MRAELTVIAAELRWLLAQVSAALSDLDAAALVWRPPAPAANSAAAIAGHVLGSTRVHALGFGCGRPVTRDRAVEFAREDTHAAALIEGLRQLSNEIAAALAALPPAALDRSVLPPPALWGTGEPHAISARQALLEAIRHAALHLGELRLTRDLALQAAADAPAPSAAAEERATGESAAPATGREAATSAALAIAPFTAAQREDCAAILRRLPAWFGFAEANAAYIAALDRLPAFVARRAATVVGFIAIERHDAGAGEIHVLAVAPEEHRRGVGQALMARAEAWLRADGRTLVHVKTLGPSDPDANYARTRAFYAALGYRPLFESTAFWGADQPALVLVKAL